MALLYYYASGVKPRFGDVGHIVTLKLLFNNNCICSSTVFFSFPQHLDLNAALFSPCHAMVGDLKSAYRGTCYALSL
jgi:hypothetical protein